MEPTKLGRENLQDWCLGSVLVPQGSLFARVLKKMTFGKETFTTKAYAAMTAGAPLVPLDIPRRKPEAGDVHIAIKFAGICHSDIHQAREEWGPAIFPMVPGHGTCCYTQPFLAHIVSYTHLCCEVNAMQLDHNTRTRNRVQ